MKAGISFTIYYDFTPYVTFPWVDDDGVYHKDGGDEPDYSKALEALNKMVKKYVENNELVFKYKGKKVDIILPIEERQCGNIFEAGECGKYANWEGIDIYCNIPNIDNSKDFDSHKLKVSEYPSEFIPYSVIWS